MEGLCCKIQQVIQNTITLQFTIDASNYIKESLSVCLSVCYSHILRMVHSIYFTLDRLVAGDPWKCGLDVVLIDF